MQELPLHHKDSVVWGHLFQIHVETSSLIPCNVQEHVEKRLQFICLHEMTCVYCRVEEVVCMHQKNTQLYSKK